MKNLYKGTSKKIIALIVVMLMGSVTVFAEYPPQGWTDSIRDGVERAQQEDKMLLLNFTGSDWCYWCKKLEPEVFGSPEFKQWSKANLVLVFLDFPNSIQLSEETIQQNQLLQQFFGIRGYPTILIMDSQLTPLLQTGYREGGPKEYIRHIQEDRNVDSASVEGFKGIFKQFIEENIPASKS